MPRNGFRQVNIKRAPGAESWIIVVHAWGWFKLPADAPCSELLLGLDQHWTSISKITKGTPVWVKIPWAELEELRIRAALADDERSSD